MKTLLKFEMYRLNNRPPFPWLLGMLVLAGVFALSGCVSGTEAELDASVGVSPAAQGIVEEVVGRDESVIPETPDMVFEKTGSPADDGFDMMTGTIDEVEAAGLIFMREEEKLARDVYLSLYETWGLAIFKNIAASEQSHTDAVKAVLTGYGLTDPVGEDVIGKFENSDLQALYDGLMEQGQTSLEEALRVGAVIEEIDILDLQERLAQTDDAEIQRVFGNLLKGSENHLRAFVSQLERQTGESYVPEFLAQSDYEVIVLAASGPGGRGIQGGNGQNGRNGRNG